MNNITSIASGIVPSVVEGKGWLLWEDHQEPFHLGYCTFAISMFSSSNWLLTPKKIFGQFELREGSIGWCLQSWKESRDEALVGCYLILYNGVWYDDNPLMLKLKQCMARCPLSLHPWWQKRRRGEDFHYLGKNGWPLLQQIVWHASPPLRGGASLSAAWLLPPPFSCP